MYVFVFLTIVPKLIVKVLNADVGPRRPDALHPYDRRQPATAAPAPQD